jgi:hypothetical protein
MTTEEEIADIKAYCERLRADLSATNAALFSLFAAIPGVYRDRVLEQLAKNSAQRAEFVDGLQDPRAPKALQQIHQAEERVYQELVRLSSERHSQGL